MTPYPELQPPVPTWFGREPKVNQCRLENLLALGCTVTTLSELLGVTRATIYNYRSGRQAIPGGVGCAIAVLTALPELWRTTMKNTMAGKGKGGKKGGGKRC